jgi:splicing factor 3A subunit 1
MYPPPPMQEQKKTDGAGAVPENDFVATHGGVPVTLRVQVPTDTSNPSWNLNGQVITMTMEAGVIATVKEVKERLAAQLGDMPANKQQMKGPLGFLKDSNTLAYYNYADGTTLEMVVRSRGGRR